MTNEEMNRYCHEVILGKCWHEMRGGRVRPARCIKDCGFSLSIRDLELVGGVVWR